MNEKVQEHFYKETLKQIVDNSPNYSDGMKYDLKALINAGKSSEEICKAMLTYFAAIRWL